MAYTWLKVDKFDIDDEWNSLYEDSKEDLDGGTVIQNSDWTEDEKKQYMISLMNDQDVHNQHNIKIYKDGVPVCSIIVYSKIIFFYGLQELLLK